MGTESSTGPVVTRFERYRQGGGEDDSQNEPKIVTERMWGWNKKHLWTLTLWALGLSILLGVGIHLSEQRNKRNLEVESGARGKIAVQQQQLRSDMETATSPARIAQISRDSSAVSILQASVAGRQALSATQQNANDLEALQQQVLLIQQDYQRTKTEFAAYQKAAADSMAELHATIAVQHEMIVQQGEQAKSRDGQIASLGRRVDIVESESKSTRNISKGALATAAIAIAGAAMRVH
jgi:hypothetical protein